MARSKGWPYKASVRDLANIVSKSGVRNAQCSTYKWALECRFLRDQLYILLGTLLGFPAPSPRLTGDSKRQCVWRDGDKCVLWRRQGLGLSLATPFLNFVIQVHSLSGHPWTSVILTEKWASNTTIYFTGLLWGLKNFLCEKHLVSGAQ